MLRCSGAKRLEISTASSSERTRMMALFGRWPCGPPARWAGLPVAVRLRLATAAARRFDVVSRMRRGVHVVLGLRQHVGGEVARVAVGRDDQDLGGPGDEVDAHLAGQQFLGRGHVDVAGADDAVGARHGAGAEGEGGDGLRAAHLEHVRRPSAARPCRGSSSAGRGRPRRCSGRPPPAPGPRSSAAWRAADSGPPGM